MKFYVKLLVICLVSLGVLFMLFKSKKEGFTSSNSCPNLLIRKGKDLFLYNSKHAKIPGVNPIKFNNLEEYVEFTKWQRSQGIKCPVLYYQPTINTQGNMVYQNYPDPDPMSDVTNSGIPEDFDPNQFMLNNSETYDKLVDSNRDDPPYNQNGYPGYDQNNQYIGSNTPLDKMTHEKGQLSANPMDNNWGGLSYTQSQIDKGVYNEDNVSIYIP